MENIRFFKSSKEWRQWLLKNHEKAPEAWIGFYNAKSGKKEINYKEAVDEALCFGWIDGIRKKLDEERYTNRFTPRRKNSNWSLVNIKRIKELEKDGRMHASGLEVFKQCNEKKSGVYSFEQRSRELLPAYEKKFRSNKKAWNYFTFKAPWYQRTSIHWVMSAKQEATRLKRLDTLIHDSENERTIAMLTRPPQKK